MPDARIYNDAPPESSYTNDTAALGVTIAPQISSKTVSPTTSNNNTSIRIGDVVTYTIVNTMPPNLISYWPYQFDYMQEGLRYITDSFTFTASPALTTTLITSGTAPTGAGYSIVQGGNPAGFNPNVGRHAASTAQQALEWWLTPIVNSTAISQFITITFRAQFVGVDMTGAPVSLSTTSTLSRTNSQALSWNRSNAGA